MDLFKSIIIHLLRISVGVVFVVSAYLKLFPIEYFEISLVKASVSTWALAPYFSRILVGVEFFLGIALIADWRSKKELVPLTFMLLLLFQAHLLLSMAVDGNSGNCGCFGQKYAMTPLQAFIKNCGLMLALVPVWKVSYASWRFVPPKWSLWSLLFVAVISINIINPPIDIYSTGATTSMMKGERAPFLSEEVLFNGQKVDLSKGKTIAVFVSATCPHCIRLGMKLHVMELKKQLPSTVVFLVGTKEDIIKYKQETELTIPIKVLDVDIFIKYAGTVFPRTYFINNGIIYESKVGYEVDI